MLSQKQIDELKFHIESANKLIALANKPIKISNKKKMREDAALKAVARRNQFLLKIKA